MSSEYPTPDSIQTLRDTIDRILDLVAAGKRVGVTAMSHKVIGKLLTDIDDAVRGDPEFRGRPVRIGDADAGQRPRPTGQGAAELQAEIEVVGVAELGVPPDRVDLPAPHPCGVPGEVAIDLDRERHNRCCSPKSRRGARRSGDFR